jgi:hypothetical protein
MLVVVVAAFGLPGSLPAQTPAAPREGEVAVDPIRCWWRTDRAAIRVGERFGLVLTCAVVETGTTAVVPALARLEPGALLLPPFEVVSGARHPDLVSPPWRYLQYEYAVRLLGEGFFGQDVPIPGLEVTYNLRDPDGGTTGRDQTYLLPELPVRVLSLVPEAASDIRDASGQTFAPIAARRSRATVARVAAAIAFAFAAVFAGLAVLGLLGRQRARRARAVRSVPATSVLKGCLNVLSEVREEALGGWTPELARRAGSALRIAGAVALGRQVAQRQVEAETARREGEVVVRTGLIRPRRVVLCAATTPRTIAGSTANGHVPGARTRAALEGISQALGVLTAASYGRNGLAGRSDLDSALEAGQDAVRRLRLAAFWPVRTPATQPRAITES